MKFSNLTKLTTVALTVVVMAACGNKEVKTLTANESIEALPLDSIMQLRMTPISMGIRW